MAKSCAACGRTEDAAAACGTNLERCSACRSVLYCNVHCQRQHRKAHRKACQRRAALIAETEADTKVVAGDKARSCAACGQTEDEAALGGTRLEWCTACRSALYCNVDCQKQHRKAHREKCKFRAEVIANAEPLDVDNDGLEEEADRACRELQAAIDSGAPRSDIEEKLAAIDSVEERLKARMLCSQCLVEIVSCDRTWVACNGTPDIISCCSSCSASIRRMKKKRSDMLDHDAGYGCPKWPHQYSEWTTPFPPLGFTDGQPSLDSLNLGIYSVVFAAATDEQGQPCYSRTISVGELRLWQNNTDDRYANYDRNGKIFRVVLNAADADTESGNFKFRLIAPTEWGTPEQARHALRVVFCKRLQFEDSYMQADKEYDSDSDESSIDDGRIQSIDGWLYVVTQRAAVPRSCIRHCLDPDLLPLEEMERQQASWNSTLQERWLVRHLNLSETDALLVEKYLRPPPYFFFEPGDIWIHVLWKSRVETVIVARWPEKKIPANRLI